MSEAPTEAAARRPSPRRVAFFFALSVIVGLALGVVMALASLIGPLAAGFAGMLIFAGIASGLGWYGYVRVRRDL